MATDTYRSLSIQHPCRDVLTKFAMCKDRITLFLDDGKQKNSIRVLDGLRGFACLAIITFHMNLLARFHGIWNPALDGIGAFISATLLFGESGVMLFFVLSSFLLFLPYGKAMLFDSEWPSMRRYYLRRIFRIWPGYYVALFLMLLFLAPQYLTAAHWDDVWLFITFRMDFPATFQRINAPFWTLAIEFQFYLILPILAKLLAIVVKQGPIPWRMLKLTFYLLLILTAGLVIHYWGLFWADTPAFDVIIPRSITNAVRFYIYGTVGKYYEVFAIGMLISMLYVYLQQTPADGQLNKMVRQLSPVIFLLGFACLSFLSLWHFYMLYISQTLHFLDPYQHFLITYYDLLPPVCYGIAYGLCMFALLQGPGWLKKPFEITPLRWIALLSYSLYIWHYTIIFHFLNDFLPTFQALGWNQFAQCCVYWLWLFLTAIPISVVLYHLIEMPGIRLGEKFCASLQQNKHRQYVVEVSTIPIPVGVTTGMAENTNSEK